MLSSTKILQMYKNIKNDNLFEEESLRGINSRECVKLSFWYKMGSTLLIFDVMEEIWKGRHPTKIKVRDGIIRYQISLEDFERIEHGIQGNSVYVYSEDTQRRLGTII